MKTITEIKKEFELAGTDGLEALYAKYAEDNRAGVAGLKREVLRKNRKHWKRSGNVWRPCGSLNTNMKI